MSDTQQYLNDFMTGYAMAIGLLAGVMNARATGKGRDIDVSLYGVGLTNLAGTLGKPVLAQVGLEEMVRARPDFLIVETASDRVIDQGTEMLHHPILAPIARLRLPQAWTVCGGPAYVEAAKALTRQLRP